MNRIIGYILMGGGFLPLVYLLNYKGSAIPLIELWFAISLFVMAAGTWFLAKHKLQTPGRNSSNISPSGLARIEKLKRHGERIRLTLDNAEIRSRTYHQEIISDDMPSRMEMFDALYDPNRNYNTEEILQTYIVFYKQYGNRNYKFVSQPSPQNEVSIKGYIDRQKGIDLYIDPQNPANYYFDLPFL